MLGLLLILVFHGPSLPACVIAPASAIADGIPVSAGARHEVEAPISQASTDRSMNSSSAYRKRFAPEETEARFNSRAIAISDGEPPRLDGSPAHGPLSLTSGFLHPLRC